MFQVTLHPSSKNTKIIAHITLYKTTEAPEAKRLNKRPSECKSVQTRARGGEVKHGLILAGKYGLESEPGRNMAHFLPWYKPVPSSCLLASLSFRGNGLYWRPLADTCLLVALLGKRHQLRGVTGPGNHHKYIPANQGGGDIVLGGILLPLSK